MRKIDELIIQYGESHNNKYNKLIHWICVPAIMFSLIGLLCCIPAMDTSQFLNVAVLVLVLSVIYYFRLSFNMGIGFIFIACLFYFGNLYLRSSIAKMGINYIWIALGIFIIAWMGQFIGHNIEGKKPSFLKDIQFLLIGPAWLMHFIMKKWNINY